MKEPLRSVLLVIVPAVFPVLLANAGEKTPPARLSPVEREPVLINGVSPREAVSLALKRNRQLVALRKGRSVAEGGMAEAKALPDPELRTGRFDFGDDSLGIRSQAYDVGLRWSPPRIGELGLKADWAMGKVSEVDGEIAAAEQRLAAEVRVLHMNIVFLDEQIRLAEASVKVREQMVEFVATQVDAGAKNLLDENIAELALADARSLPAVYRQERQVAMNRLAAELDLPQFNGLTIRVEGEPLVFEPRQLEAPALVTDALARRQEFAMLSARCRQADARLGLRKRELYPWLSFVQLNREFGGGYTSNAWGFRVGIDLPVFKWLQGNTQTPAAELDQCRSDTEAMKHRIRTEVEELVERLKSDTGELEHYRKTVEPLAAQAIELAQRAEAAGQGEPLQRLAAEARRLSRSQSHLSKLQDYRRLEIELDKALGIAIAQ